MPTDIIVLAIIGWTVLHFGCLLAWLLGEPYRGALTFANFVAIMIILLTFIGDRSGKGNGTPERETPVAQTKSTTPQKPYTGTILLKDGTAVTYRDGELLSVSNPD